MKSKHYDVRLHKTGHQSYHLGLISCGDMDCIFEKNNMSPDEVFAVLERYGIINNFNKQ